MNSTAPSLLGGRLEAAPCTNHHLRPRSAQCSAGQNRSCHHLYGAVGLSTVRCQASFTARADSNGASQPATKKPPVKASAKGFANRNRFWVPPSVVVDFEAEWRFREACMAKHGGFLGLEMVKQGSDEDYVCTSRWASVPEWEKWSCSPEARRSHLPLTVMQYVPSNREGFPEDFVPFRAMQQAVNAKY
ncbi:hypothetical protein WJX72_001959 [[Myrmecia] bisecta]|uniref:ABM domain-containing protein n=1 Tax=[Myrmecia] bisecta TaxID=41462 RepID=A0AAW1PJI9_9CHLO